MANYFTLITREGLVKITNAQLTNSKIEITEVVVGDGNGAAYTPTGTETQLKRVVWRGGVSSIEIDAQNPNWIVAEAVIPASAGGFTIREVGLYDAQGTLIAIGNYPDTYKPVLADGSTMDLALRTIIEVSNASSVTLRVDPNVIVASRAYVDTRLDAKSDKNKIVVFAGDFGVKADYSLATFTGTDDTEALQRCFDYAVSNGAIEVVLPAGLIKVTRTLTINARYMKVRGQGFATEIVYDGPLYNSTSNPDGQCIVRVGGSGSTPRITFDSVSFHGSNKTQWCVTANNTSSLTFNRCRFRRSWGFLRVDNSPLFNTDNCVFEYCTDKKPADALAVDWNVVKSSGVIRIYECHGYSMNEYFLYSIGHDEATPLTSAVFLDSNTGGTWTKGVIERDNQYISGTEADERFGIRHLFYLPTQNRNFILNQIYVEHMNIQSVVASTSPVTNGIDIDHLYVHMCSVYLNLLYLPAYTGASVGDIFIWGTYIKNDVLVYVSDALKDDPITGKILINYGKPNGIHNRKILADGLTYSDPEKAGQSGHTTTNGNVVSDGHKFIRVLSGLEVTRGFDGIGNYIAVSAGILTNHEGKNIQVGITLSPTISVGVVLRPTIAPVTTYNVCVDVYGGVWVEPENSPKSANLGKAILAKVISDSQGTLYSVVKNENIHKGIYINNAANKHVYSTEIPRTGTWSRGDRLTLVLGTAGGASEAVCITGGSPGVWNQSGTISE